MELIAHRGMWHKEDERNTLSAFYRGLDSGFGLEVDIRDIDGDLIISHDMPFKSTTYAKLDELFFYYSKYNFTSTLALNIKSDGLQSSLFFLLTQFDIKNYFVFDMSIPDAIHYAKLNMNLYKRRSEFEPHCPSFITNGVWLDELTMNWVDSQSILTELSRTEKLCIVSRELHRRDKSCQWDFIKEITMIQSRSDKILLCTDYPEEARGFFNESDKSNFIRHGWSFN